MNRKKLISRFSIYICVEFLSAMVINLFLPLNLKLDVTQITLPFSKLFSPVSLSTTPPLSEETVHFAPYGLIQYSFPEYYRHQIIMHNNFLHKQPSLMSTTSMQKLCTLNYSLSYKLIFGSKTLNELIIMTQTVNRQSSPQNLVMMLPSSSLTTSSNRVMFQPPIQINVQNVL